MGKIPLQKVMTEQILQTFLPFMKLEGLLLRLRTNLVVFLGQTNYLPKVNLVDKSKYYLSMHNFTLTILNGSCMFRLHKLAIFMVYISEV